MWRRRVLYVGGLLGALAFFMNYRMWFSAFVMLTLLLLPLFSIGLSLFSLRAKSVTMRCDRTVVRGENAELRIQESCKSFFQPPPVAITVVVTDSMTGDKNTFDLELCGGKAQTFILESRHCGYLTFHAKRLVMRDYLGIFSIPLKPPEDVHLAVMPVECAPSPLPDLSMITPASYRPKPSGGYSEIHELRDYRLGDSMREIHWKLSAKADRLVVREPQIPNHGTVVVSFELDPDTDRADAVLDRLCYICRWMLEHETEHDVRWVSTAERGIVSKTVASLSDIEPLLFAVMRDPLPDASSASAGIEKRRIICAYRYHITVSDDELRLYRSGGSDE